MKVIFVVKTHPKKEGGEQEDEEEILLLSISLYLFSRIMRSTVELGGDELVRT